jgi:hypothetical protein
LRHATMGTVHSSFTFGCYGGRLIGPPTTNGAK